MPLARDIKTIRSRYGRACGGFFMFHRFISAMSFLMLLLFLPLLVFQGLTSDEGLFVDSCGKVPLGCGWFYGGFFKTAPSTQSNTDQTRDVWLAVRYMGAVVLSSASILCFSVLRWGNYDFNYKSEELSQELQPRRWSQVVLAAWDFRLAGEDRHNWQDALANQLKALREDEKESEQSQKRTRLQRYLLYLRRAFGMFCNFCLILIAWAALAFANLKRNAIKSVCAAVVGGSAGESISSLAPNIIVALVGSLLPSLTKGLISFEAWSPTVQARQQMWRLYLGKIFTIFILVAINVELVAGVPLFGQEQVLAQRDTSYRCVEDQVATRLLSLVATEFALILLRPLNTLISAYGMHFAWMCSTSDFMKPTFDMADYAVDLIYFQCLLWSTAVWAPSIVIVAPLLFLCHFKWLKFALYTLSSRPFVAETSALSVSLLQLNCVSSLLFVGIAYALVTRALPHDAGCGPFESRLAPGAMLSRIETPGIATARSVILWCWQHPGVLFPLLALLILLALTQRNRSRALHATLGQLQNASQRHVESLEAELWRMERQNELLNRRVQYHEKHEKSSD